MKQLPHEDLFPRGVEHFRHWHIQDKGALALVLAHLSQQDTGPLVVLTSSTQEARQLEDALQFYLAHADTPVALFPDWETLPYDLFSPQQAIINERIRVLHQLPTLKKGVILVPINTLLQRLPPKSHVSGSSFDLAVGDTFDLDATRQRLTESGYRHSNTVYESGEFAIRGAIMDVFPMGETQPFRIELFDDEIESLRLFDAETQRSTGTVERITLLPAAEYPLSEAGIAQFRESFRETFDVDYLKNQLYLDVTEGIPSPGLEYYLPLFYPSMATLFDYLPANAGVVELPGLEAAAQQVWEHIESRYESRRHDAARPLLPPQQLFLPQQELQAQLKKHGRARLNSKEGVAFPFAPMPALVSGERQHPLTALLTLAESTPSLRILLVAESEGRQQALLELLQKRQVQPTLMGNWATYVAAEEKPQWALAVGRLHEGFYHPEEQLLVVAEPQLYGQRTLHERRRTRHTTVDAENVFRSLGELTVGDPVVHIEHGVGRYQGLTHMQVDGQEHEFLVLEYAGGDKIYLPVSSLHLISRYGGSNHEHAPLTRLGSEQWTKARERAAEKIHDVAAELLNTYARREARKGRAFTLPQEAYDSFAGSFPYAETPDQATAITSVLKDMTADRPMDRLVCGDVGFGKTEVAMRAAFLAVQNNTQVAVLVPTTLLAQQHYDSFVDRFAKWAVNIEVLSRFRTAKEKQQVLEGLAAGKVDIVVGTHQLLQDSVKFKDLGLVIVDEEHRFGVRHKEKLKALRAEADILTLTATPIPRTLNMAMAGMRDISVIATPPEQRLPVRTFVTERSHSIIHEAIQRELLRGGQVYYLNNDIHRMESLREELQALVPDARVGIAHGQMRERELEQVMTQFYHRQFNVLLCTTIIETGIDIPSANTIIIERADKLGLAQLHQLRGRVGRSHHQAYAFMLTPPSKALTKDAQKRLEAIQNASELGAGFMLANHDLEIRGAGELLGEEQHGHIETIGFTLYMDMLEQAVESLKRGETPDMETPLKAGPEINLGLPALIPEDYLPDVFMRLTLYKRIANCKTPEALNELKVEMIDRFGLLPPQVNNLCRLTELRWQAEALGITRIDVGKEYGRITFSEKTAVDPLKLVLLVQRESHRYQLQGGQTLRFSSKNIAGEERFTLVETLLEKLTPEEE